MIERVAGRINQADRAQYGGESGWGDAAAITIRRERVLGYGGAFGQQLLWLYHSRNYYRKSKDILNNTRLVFKLVCVYSSLHL